jgi:hypothetical protein
MPVSQSAAVIIPPQPVATAAPARASRRRQSASTTAPSSASASHRPEKYAVLEPLGKKTKAGAIPVHDLDEVGLPAPEQEKVAREGILPQDTLYQQIFRFYSLFLENLSLLFFPC